MHSSRRSFLRGVASIAGAASAQTAYAQHVHPATKPPPPARRSTEPVPAVAPYEFGSGIVPVVSPDVPDMPWRLENGVKVFDISVGHVRTEFIPGRIVDAWGFNGSVPGPTIEVNEGDRVRFIVENRLMADERLTLQEIGKNFGISRERARQIEGNVLRKLREALATAGLDAEQLGA